MDNNEIVMIDNGHGNKIPHIGHILTKEEARAEWEYWDMSEWIDEIIDWQYDYLLEIGYDYNEVDYILDKIDDYGFQNNIDDYMEQGLEIDKDTVIELTDEALDEMKEAHMI